MNSAPLIRLHLEEEKWAAVDSPSSRSAATTVSDEAPIDVDAGREGASSVVDVSPPPPDPVVTTGVAGLMNRLSSMDIRDVVRKSSLPR